MTFALQVLLVVFAWLGHTIAWVAMVNRSHAYHWPRWVVDLSTLLGGAGVLFFCWPLAEFSLRVLATESVARGTWLPATFVQGYGWGMAGVFVASAVHWLWRHFHAEREQGLGEVRRLPLPLDSLASKEEYLAPGVPRVLGTLPGNQVLQPEIAEKTLLIPDLPEGFEGFRIAHLSDLHMSGRIVRDYYDAVVEATNRWGADLVAITGDIVERTTCLDWIEESLAQLEGRYGRLFVLGNHDLRANPAEIRTRMVAAGFLDMGGRRETLRVAQGTVDVVGNEAPWFRGPEPSNLADPPVTPGALRLAMVHTPDLFGWGAEQGFHVMLAGHNHGGQVCLPGLGPIVTPSRYGTRYAGGVFGRGGTVMHVSRGTSSLAPLRWNCPPELALVTLNRR